LPKLTAFPRDQKTDTARSGMKSSNDDAIVQAPSDLIAHLVAENASKRLDGSSMNELLALIGTEAALWSVRRATIPAIVVAAISLAMGLSACAIRYERSRGPLRSVGLHNEFFSRSPSGFLLPPHLFGPHLNVTTNKMG
jgi:hypothetical protein